MQWDVIHGKNAQTELGLVDKNIALDEMRFSAGLSVLWVSPFGPINVSFAKALNDDAQDETEVFQFGMGTNF